MKIYKSGVEDREKFVKLRVELFEELGEKEEDTTVEELIYETGNYYINHINKDLFCWFTEIEGEVVGVASMCIFCRIPYFQNPVGLEGYILNVYTLPKYRNRGVATKLIKEIINFSRDKSIKRLWLNASEAGKKVYRDLGFIEKENEMEYFL